ARSSAASHCQAEPAMFRKTRVILQLCDFQRPEGQHAIFDLTIRSLEQALQRGDDHALYPRYSLRCSNELAQIHAVTETEIVGVEEAPASVQQVAAAEELKQCCFHVSPQIVRLDTDRQSNVKWHKPCWLHFNIVANTAVPMESSGNSVAQ